MGVTPQGSLGVPGLWNTLEIPRVKSNISLNHH
jgi:hypothetical protein